MLTAMVLLSGRLVLISFVLDFSSGVNVLNRPKTGETETQQQEDDKNCEQNC